MKNVLFAATMLFAVSFCSASLVSCSSDDQEDMNVNQNEILGSWYEEKIKSGENSKSEIVATWTFNSDKTGTERVEGYLTTKYTDRTKIVDKTVDFTYSYNGKQVVVVTRNSGKDATSTYDVTINGNKMRMGNETGGYFNLTKK